MRTRERALPVAGAAFSGQEEKDACPQGRTEQEPNKEENR